MAKYLKGDWFIVLCNPVLLLKIFIANVLKWKARLKTSEMRARNHVFLSDESLLVKVMFKEGAFEPSSPWDIQQN